MPHTSNAHDRRGVLIAEALRLDDATLAEPADAVAMQSLKFQVAMLAAMVEGLGR